MSRTSIRRWLRAGAAVAATATFNATAPAADAAPTPCNNPSGTIAQGYVFDEYLLIQHDRLDDGSGAKLCFQTGGRLLAAGDTYGVIDIPLPSGGTNAPYTDSNSDACLGHGGRTLYDSYTAGVGSLRITYLSRSTDVQLCTQGYTDDGTRVLSTRTKYWLPQWTNGEPAVGTVTPAPARDTTLISAWPAGAPSSGCSDPETSRTWMDLYLAGRATRIASDTPAFVDVVGGTSTICVRTQDATGRGAGGRVAVNTGAMPDFDVYGDRTPCTRPVHHMNAPAYLHVDVSPIGSGNQQSVCLSTGPASTTRVQITPAVTDLVTFQPDPGTP